VDAAVVAVVLVAFGMTDALSTGTSSAPAVVVVAFSGGASDVLVAVVVVPMLYVGAPVVAGRYGATVVMSGKGTAIHSEHAEHIVILHFSSGIMHLHEHPWWHSAGLCVGKR